ncbi:MAG: DUF1987 domain-containing protein [Magnetococcus sp. YQC-3]
MERLRKEKTESTPFIQLDADTHLLEIRGESIPENTFEFYADVIEWIEKYLQETKTPLITVEIELSYFNSSSSKMIMDLLDLLDANVRDDRVIKVRWMYDVDNDMAEEHGEGFSEELEHVTFEMTPIP